MRSSSERPIIGMRIPSFLASQATHEYAAGLQTKSLTYEMMLLAPYRYLVKSEVLAGFGDKGYLVPLEPIGVA